jgi:hypothetical protein
MVLGTPNGGERRPMLLNMGREQYLFMGDRPGRIDPNPAQEEVEQLLGAELARSAEPKAIGGAVRRGRAYRVAERRPELLDVQGERFVLMGSQRVRSATAGRQATPAASNVTVNVTVPAGTAVQTANQIAAAVARKLRVATLRNA